MNMQGNPSTYPRTNKDEKEDKERFLEIIFIARSDFNRFNDLTMNFLKGDIQGMDKYQATVSKAYKLLEYYEANGLASTSK